MGVFKIKAQELIAAEVVSEDSCLNRVKILSLQVEQVEFQVTYGWNAPVNDHIIIRAAETEQHQFIWSDYKYKTYYSALNTKTTDSKHLHRWKKT